MVDGGSQATTPGDTPEKEGERATSLPMASSLRTPSSRTRSTLEPPPPPGLADDYKPGPQVEEKRGDGLRVAPPGVCRPRHQGLRLLNQSPKSPKQSNTRPTDSRNWRPTPWRHQRAQQAVGRAGVLTSSSWPISSTSHRRRAGPTRLRGKGHEEQRPATATSWTRWTSLVGDAHDPRQVPDGSPPKD